MGKDRLETLLQEYKNAPEQFHATAYWDSYEKRLLDSLSGMDMNQLRSGKYPLLSTFGFNDVVYTYYHPSASVWKKVKRRFIHQYLIKNKGILPYGIKTADIREMAYHHCQLMGDVSHAKPITDLEVSTFGAPEDLFELNSQKYTMSFLSYYLRYCFAQKHLAFKGDEVIVELGSGSGYQVEVLKKLYPKMTILCFDLPAQVYLCERYLSEALNGENIVGTDQTLKWKDLSELKKGSVHFFGNWQMPLLKDFQFDLFWNAASFGEMEPEVVANYLGYVKENAKSIYLLQARHGKETSGKTHVKNPIAFEDYDRMLSGYLLQEEHDAWLAHKKLSQSGGYFEGIWAKN